MISHQPTTIRGVMPTYLWIPLYSAFVGMLSMFLPLAFIFYSAKGFQFFRRVCSGFFADVDFEEIVEDKLDNDVFDAEVELLLDQKLDDLVLVFKREIPMAGTFLVGGLVQKLKRSAKGEILKMVPEIKQRLLQRMKKDLDSQMIVNLIIESVQVSRLTKYIALLCLAGGFIGFLLGLPLAINLAIS